jgi:hypothetical protein
MRLPPPSTTLYAVLMLGQSRACGSDGFAANVVGALPREYLRPSSPAHSYMPKCATGTVPSGESDERCGSNRQNPSATLADQQLQSAWITGLTPRRAEQYTTSVSAMSPGLPYADAMLTNKRALGGRPRTRVATYAIGGVRADMWEDPPGTALANLNVPFDDMVTGETRFAAIAAKYGWRTEVPVVFWLQDEADYNITGYRATFLGVQAAINAELRSIHGQGYDPLWISDQSSAFEDADSRYPVTDKVTMHKARDLLLIGPNYREYAAGFATDFIHNRAEGYIRIADLAEDIRRRVQDLGQTTYDPCVYSTSATRASGSADFYVNYHLSTSGTTLVLDDSAITDPGDYGFQVFANGAELTISSVTINSATQVKITVSAVPSNVSNEVRYANVGFTTAFGTTNPDGYVQTEMARGCLRDDSVRTTSDGTQARAPALHEPSISVTVT